MKKLSISILFLTLLLTGCASKPKEGKYAREARLRAAKREAELVVQIKQLVYKKTVSHEEIIEARKLAFTMLDADLAHEKRCSYLTKTKRKDFSGKITNTTSEAVNLRVFPRGTYTETLGHENLPDVDFIIPPHETYYFIIENFFALGEEMVAIQKLGPDKSYRGGYVLEFNGSIFNDRNSFFPIIEEVLKYHSVELIYDHAPGDKDLNKYKYQFVKPFDDEIKSEKNLIILHQ